MLTTLQLGPLTLHDVSTLRSTPGFHNFLRPGLLDPQHRFPLSSLDGSEIVKYLVKMKTASIQDLKKRLSSYLISAGASERIIITKHNKPLAALEPANQEHLHVGAKVGRWSPKPIGRNVGGGRALEILREDRQGEQ